MKMAYLMFALRYFDVSGGGGGGGGLEPFRRVLRSGGWVPLKKNRFDMTFSVMLRNDSGNSCN